MAIPKINIQIGADTSSLNRNLRRGETMIQKFGRNASRSLDALAVAAGAAAFAIGQRGVEAAIADEAAQAKLAKGLQNSADATNKKIKAVEDYINRTQLATGVTDDELRPSLDRLVRSTGNVKKGIELQRLAMDVAAGTGKDLSAVTEAIAKAHDGTFTSLKRLGIPLDENIIKSKDFKAATEALAAAFEGQAAVAANTAAGKMERLKIVVGEAEESIGAALLPTIEELTDYVTSPEGQKFINDFAVAMGDAFKAAAQAMPPILAGLKQIAKSAAAMNIDFSTFADPKLMAAATAFRLTPGPIQVKAIAAVAAYTAGAVGESQSTDQQQLKATDAIYGRVTGLGLKAQPQLDVGSYFAGTWSGAQAAAQQGYFMTGATRNPTVVNNIKINAIDPVQTARQIAKITNGQNGNASSPKYQAFLR